MGKREMLKQGYREPVHCEDCKHVKTQERACGSQSFYTEYRCKLGKFEVNPLGTCDKWKDTP